MTRIVKPVRMDDVGALSAQSDQPILFENIVGKPGFRLCDILVKTRRAQARTLGTTPEDYLRTLAYRLRQPPRGLKLVRSGPVKEVIKRHNEADWSELPIPFHKEGDATPYVTAMNIIRDPQTGFYNSCHAGTHAVGPRRGLISFVTPHSHVIMRKYLEMGMDHMPIAFVFGVPPAYEIMANFSGLHMDMWGEMEMVGTLMDRDVEMVPCETIELNVPAEAEIVVEGRIALNGAVPRRRRHIALDVSPAASREPARGRDHRHHDAGGPADLPQSPDLPGHRSPDVAAPVPRGHALQSPERDGPRRQRRPFPDLGRGAVVHSSSSRRRAKASSTTR